MQTRMRANGSALERESRETFLGTRRRTDSGHPEIVTTARSQRQECRT